MKTPNIIAIDGPAASGKTTLGKRMANALGFLFLDTGVMYRAITWGAISRAIPIDDEEAISNLAENAQIDVRPASLQDGRSCDVLLDGVDITWETRCPEVEENVSPVSTYPRVRAALSAQQRVIGLRGEVVMVGRDIGTVVLPEADIKVYLDASPEERAKRRYSELKNRGEEADFNIILSGVYNRDRIDSNRALAPLRPAEDAIIIDSDTLSADEVFLTVESLWKK